MKKFIFMKLILIYGANFLFIYFYLFIYYLFIIYLLFIYLNILLLFLNIFIIKNE